MTALCPRCKGQVLQKYDTDPFCLPCGWQDYSPPLRKLRELVLARPSLPGFEDFAHTWEDDLDSIMRRRPLSPASNT